VERTFQERGVRVRKTKIVATLGPATSSEEAIKALIQAGVNVFRLNFSHGTHEEHADRIRKARRLSKSAGKPVALLQDLQGPRIRTGAPPEGQTVRLDVGVKVQIVTDSEQSTAGRVSIDFPRLPQSVRPGQRVLIADGAIELRVDRVAGKTTLDTVVVRGGTLDGRKGVNLPGADLPIPSFTEKDQKDLEFGIAHGVDYVALSFVRRARDVEEVQRWLEHRRHAVPIIVKVEKPEAVERLDEIVAACQGIMVARGDLGVELSPERVPMIQKRIIQAANEAGIPVITATQMLESMVNSPWPTRAEASDVANAILDGTDAVMLSAETAVGKYAVQAVETMDRIALDVERQAPSPARERPAHPAVTASMSHAAVTLAEELPAEAIVSYTRSGFTAHQLSKTRPRMPIFAFTSAEPTYRRLALWYGVTPLLGPFIENTDLMLAAMERELASRKLVERGAPVVIVRLSPPNAQHRWNFITVQAVRGARGGARQR
jgi:pyruvate kinase